MRAYREGGLRVQELVCLEVAPQEEVEWQERCLGPDSVSVRRRDKAQRRKARDRVTDPVPCEARRHGRKAARLKLYLPAVPRVRLLAH
eukprot:1309234-Alexandrium_andersonii.AAC.1